MPTLARSGRRLTVVLAMNSGMPWRGAEVTLTNGCQRRTVYRLIGFRSPTWPNGYGVEVLSESAVVGSSWRSKVFSFVRTAANSLTSARLFNSRGSFVMS